MAHTCILIGGILIRLFLVCLQSGPQPVCRIKAVMRVVFPETVPADKRAVCVQVPKGNPAKDMDEKHAQAMGAAWPVTILDIAYRQVFC